MAMSMRSQGLGSSTTGRPRHRPAYEDFKPLIESKEDPNSHSVYIHLPGFLKEQIRIMAESNKAVLRVRGERLISDNRWSRFQEEVPVPAICDITDTRAKFEGGVLRITMPKRIPSAASPSPSPTALSDDATSPERSPPPPRRPVPLPPITELPHRPVALPPPRTTEVPHRPIALPPPPAPRTAALPPLAAEIPIVLPPPKPMEPILAPNFQPNPPQSSMGSPPWATPLPLPTTVTPIIRPRPREEEKPELEAHRQPAPAGIVQALPQSSNPMAWRDPMEAEEKWRRFPRGDPAAPRKEQMDADKWRMEGRFPVQQQGAPIDADKWMAEARFPPDALKSAAGKTGEGMRISHESMEEEEDKHKKQMKAGVSGGRRMEEDLQLLVNMGVAVMVMLGLGAWISYSYGNGGTPPNPTI